MVNIDLNRIFGLMVAIVGVLSACAQDQVTLRFSGHDQNGQYVQLDRVLVENVSQHWQEVLYYPDTTLFIGQTGIGEIGQPGKGVRLFQNVPNPFDGVTDFVLYLPEASDVLLGICDLNGKAMATYKGSLDPGDHLFRAWLDAPQTTTPYRYCPRGHDSEVPKFGHLYNWAAAMHGAVSIEANPSGVQGICPTGWHLPSDAEWQQLNGYVSSHNEYSCGGDSFNIAKALASTKHWDFSYSECAVGNNPKDNNATGFSALPAGYNEGQIFEWAVFWSASQPQPQYGNAHYAGFNHGTSILLHTGAPYGVAFGLQLSSSASVRCLRD